MGIMLNSAPTLEGSLANAASAASTIMTTIEGDELLFTLFAASILFMGASLVKKIKSAAKH